jgi:glycosyltransferase involved in cell wall biosynthesis
VVSAVIMTFSDHRSGERETRGPPRQGCDVLLVTTHLGPGGTREMLDLIAEELLAQGLVVRVAALYRGRDGAVRDVPCDVLLEREIMSASGYVIAFIRLIKRTCVIRPAAILSFMPAANIMGALSGAICGVHRRLATHHQPAWTQHSALRIIDRVLGSIGIYSNVVAISRSIQASLANYPRSYVNRVCIIPNAIRPVAPRNDRLAVRRHFGLRADSVLFVAIGRLSPEKNLLNTLAGALRVPGIQLALAGDGPLRSEIDRYISTAHLGGKVFMLGQVDRQVAADLLFAGDVFIQLSHYEGRSLALLEALYAELAVIVSDIPSQREVLTTSDGSVAGVLCDANDVNAIAEAMSAVARDEQLRRQLAAKTRVLKRKLDSARMAREYASLLMPA